MHRAFASTFTVLTIVVAAVAVADSTFGQAPDASSTPGGFSLLRPDTSDTPRPGDDATAANSGSASPSIAPSAAVEGSVVKVFSSMRAPDFGKPWTKLAAEEVTGTGVVIEGRRILTNAHVVAYSSEVQIQANQAGDKIPATVEVVGRGIDLAILKVEDERFFDTHAALPRAEMLPEIKNEVMVYGYPTGGTSLSITKGIVSRIEFNGYDFPVSGLRIQLDAAINPGNSGGPAVVDNKMIGLAFSRLGGAENIGYVIPCEEIELFLHAIAGGHYAGKPGFFERWQTLENPALRPFLKLPKDSEGIIVRQPLSDDVSYPLKPWDVITHIGNTPIDDQGMVKVGPDLRVRFPYLVQHTVKDGKVPLTIMRQGKDMRIELPAPTNYRWSFRTGVSTIHRTSSSAL